MNFKQIYKQVKKHIESEPVSEIDAVKYMNMAYEEWFRVCIVCHKKMKSYKGVKIHIAKAHPEVKKRVERYVYLQGLN